jgi:hypothetical protein
MSVSGVPSVPGFDVLFPSTTTGTSSSSTTSSSGLSSNVPGADVLNAPLNTQTVPGFDVLSPASYFPGASNDANSSSSTGSNSDSTSTTNSNSTSTSGSSTAVNPYQQAYNNVETWSANYLMSSIENGAPSSLPELTGGESAGAFAGMSQTLAALKPLAQLEAGAGVGTSSSTTSSVPATGTSSSAPSSSGQNSIGSIVNALA